jgi:hypothetical protein
VCEECAIAKAKQKNTNKVAKGGSQNSGERIYIDISSIKGENFGGSKFWALIVDDYTDFCWSYFLRKKSDLKEKLVNFIQELKTKKIDVKFVRCDNAGENKALEDHCNHVSINVSFEYSGPRTPERNEKVERKYQTLYGRIRAILNGAGLKDEVRSGIWTECASTATFYSNILLTNGRSKSPQELMFGNKSHCVNNLRLFGKMGVVTTKEKIQGKLKDRGTVCMFVGYPPSHACNIYRMLNMSTRHVIKSRDIKWLHKIYEDWCVKEDPESEKDDEIDNDDPILANTKAQETVEQYKKKDKGSKVIREMKKLQG